MVPNDLKYVSYYRVSTARQGRSGLGLEAQQAAVQAYLQRQPGAVELAHYVEVESGKRADRPQLQAALLHCRQTRATLLVARLDRLSRDVAFLMTLRNSDVQFQALDIPEANTLTVGVMAVLAQHQREYISKTTKEALAARRARGLPLGNPRDMRPYVKRAAKLAGRVSSTRARARASDIAPMIAAARAEGHVTLMAIAAYLNQREIPTPRGRVWRPSTVRNLLRMVDRL